MRTSVMIDGNPFDVQVSVDEDHINEITMVHLDETVETMYPLVRPTLDELAKQIISSQSLTDLTYSKNNQYTCRLLIGAVSEALEKASSKAPRRSLIFKLCFIFCLLSKIKNDAGTKYFAPDLNECGIFPCTWQD